MTPSTGTAAGDPSTRTPADVPLDDLGHPVPLPRPPRRVVSLVPSLTEALAVSVPDRLVGATDWCTHPAGLDVPRVRGTKNPSRAAIGDLAPDLVVANQEENRELDVRRLREAGIPVWVTRIETLDDAFASMRRLFGDVLQVSTPDWLADAEQAWAEPPEPGPRVAVAIWRDPWMWVGARTFTGDLLARLGCTNAVTAERYPVADPAEVDAELVLLPDEPYVFTAHDGPEAFPGRATALVSGRQLTWYGPSLTTARADLLAAVAGQGRMPRS